MPKAMFWFAPAVGISVWAITQARQSQQDPWWVMASLHLSGLSLIVGGLLLRTRPLASFHGAEPATPRFGVLVAGLGISWYAIDLKDSPNLVIHSIGSCLYYVHLVVLAHMALAYPSGRLPNRATRVLLALTYSVSVVLMTLRYATERMTKPWGWLDGTQRLFWARLGSGLAIAVIVLVLGYILQRWRSSTHLDRLYLSPLWVTGALGPVVLIGLVAAASDATETAEHNLLAAHGIGLNILLIVAVTDAFRRRLARVGVADLLVELEIHPGPEGLQSALSKAVDDPHLRLLLWQPDRETYADVPMAKSAPPQARTHIEQDGQPLALLLHDPELSRQPGLIPAVISAVRLVLENSRRMEELRNSRARIIQAEIEGRKHVQRDLHDGAQQDLVVLNLTLQQLDTMVGGQLPYRNDTTLGALVGQAISELRIASDNLQNLSRGMLPTALARHGLAGAISSLAERAPFTVTVQVDVDDCPTDVATATYFLVSEALVNVARHAGARHAAVSVLQLESHIVAQVRDDGGGGAAPAAGSGLDGLRTRLHRLRGELIVESSEEGTVVTGHIPCG